MTIWKMTPSLLELNERCQGTLISSLGISFAEIGLDFVRAHMSVTRAVIQPEGILHGGASAALAETVGSAAAMLALDRKNHFSVGIDLNINHIRQGQIGDLITATARPFHLGKSTQVWGIDLMNQKEERIAVARLTVAILER
jgi:uncharacterized protein (TIGR00369 family)